MELIYEFLHGTLQVSLNTISMKIHLITVRLEIRLGCEKSKPVIVAPYIRIRNGKKELVRGYKKEEIRVFLNIPISFG